MLKQLSAAIVLLFTVNSYALPELKTVGEGTYRYLFWQLYDARLASESGTFESYRQSSPLLLALTYKRDISKQQFIDATIDEWRKLGRSSEQQQQQWAGQLQSVWQDVKEGDTLSALLKADGSVIFYFNGEETGTLTDANFGSAFFDIWLHPDTSAPKLRRQLIAAQ